MVQIAAVAALILCGGMSIFQLLLASGLPLGKFAWGGQHLILSSEMRVASLVAAVLFLFFAVIILNQSQFISIFPRQGWPHYALIAIGIYFCLGTVMNLLSQSAGERFVMAPIAALIAAICLYIATQVK